jgi:hypothetical protein
MSVTGQRLPRLRGLADDRGDRGSLQGGHGNDARAPKVGWGKFTLGAQVIVRESQAAVFFRDGKGLATLAAAD